jgi:Circularly permutated YpsA SLOG family
MWGNKKIKIAKIVSGGQTGADRGGLDAAIWCEIPYGGWIPKGRKAEDGVVPFQYKGLKESSSADYLARTEANVVDSDVTFVFCYGIPTRGSKKTVDFSKKHVRPCLAVDLSEDQCLVVDRICGFVSGLEDISCVLNVAGSRESKSPGIERAVAVVMTEVISRVNGRCFYPPQEGD